MTLATEIADTVRTSGEGVEEPGKNGAAAVLKVLERWGIDKVFICPGSTEAAFLDAAYASKTVEVVITTDEAISISIADGYTRLTGRPAVAYIHANVGLGNGISHLYAANVGRSPLVVLNGIKASTIQGRGAFTSADNMVDFVREYTKYAWHVAHPSRVAEDVNRAIRLAQMQPTGPTWVGLPQDYLEAEHPYPLPEVDRYRISARTRPDDFTIAAAASALRSAKSPLIVAGTDARNADAVGELVRLAEFIGAAVLLEERVSQERVAFPQTHANVAGAYAPQHPILGEADVIFFAGTRCFKEFRHPKGPHVPSRPVILHGHSDPTEIANLYPVDVGLAGDMKLTLAALADELGDDGTSRASLFEPGSSSVSPVPQGTSGDYLTVSEVAQRVADVVTPEVLVVDDSTTSRTYFVEALGDSAVDSLHMSSAGSLGWCIGAGLGMQLASDRQRVITIVGDGGMQFGLAGLWSAVTYKIPNVILVINNTTYAAVGASLREFDGANFEGIDTLDLPGVDISGPNFAEIAAGFGVDAYRITQGEELSDRIKAALASDAPTLLEVMTDPQDLGRGMPVIKAGTSA